MKSIYEENYHSKAFVEILPDFIGWVGRRKAEGGFLKKILEKNNCRKVFESSLGDGCDSIYLLKEGFDVTSNDLDLDFIKKAQQNARNQRVKLNITSFDWRRLGTKIEKESFDAVLCLGNSLTYLFRRKDQLKTLRQFYTILKKNGVLLIDERNYQFFLDNSEKFLGENYVCRKKVVYCGEKVDAKPVFISKNKIVFEYFHKEKKIKSRLILYPFKDGELLALLKEAGFKKIQQFSDFKKGKDNKADFFTYVAYK